MKKQISLAVLLGALAVAGMCAFLASSGPSTPYNNASNGAFRDGMYQGTQDAVRGDTPHLALAGQASDAERNAFAKGYKKAYQDTLSTLDGNNELSQNSSASYQDGLFLGKLDAKRGLEEHISSGRWWQARDQEMFSAGYRRAYLYEMAELVTRSQPTSQALAVAEPQN
jgi:hypothetical protein